MNFKEIKFWTKFVWINHLNEVHTIKKKWMTIFPERLGVRIRINPIYTQSQRCSILKFWLLNNRFIHWISRSKKLVEKNMCWWIRFSAKCTSTASTYHHQFQKLPVFQSSVFRKIISAFIQTKQFKLYLIILIIILVKKENIRLRSLAIMLYWRIIWQFYHNFYRLNLSFLFYT